MKKYTVILICSFIMALGVCSYLLTHKKTPVEEETFSALPDEQPHLYININDTAISKLYVSAHKLKKSLLENGYQTELSCKNNFKSGAFNLYITDSIHSIPQVIDTSAINILWLPLVQNTDDVSLLRPFDVIIVKSMTSFQYLKAINVRTAYIPDAINIKDTPHRNPNGKAMFYGDNTDFILPLYLAGHNDMSVDIFGKGFNDVWPEEEIKGVPPTMEDFNTYSTILLQQQDNNIRDELIDDKIIETLENGGLPYLRFNNGVYKLFGEVLPMYHNEQEFVEGVRELEQNPALVQKIKYNINRLSQQWNSHSQALKISEIFEIMKKKRR